MSPTHSLGTGEPAADLGGFASATDWSAVGLVMAIVGAFLLANAILFRHPRALVEEHFTGRRRHLTTIRDFIFHRVNVHLGFVFLLGGFALQLYGQLQPPAEAPRELPTPWVGVVLLAAIALELLGWWWSHRLFRRYVRAYLREDSSDLLSEGRLTREVGELFGISAAPEDTVESYAARLRIHLGLPAPGRGAEFESAPRGGRGRSGSSAPQPVDVEDFGVDLDQSGEPDLEQVAEDGLV